MTRVVDASPLIVLAKVGRLDLLNEGGREVLVAETVYQEVLAGDGDDPARQALAAGWGQRTPDVPLVPALGAWRLDPGEEATLAMAQCLRMPGLGVVAVLDDGDGRRAARALGIPHTGTVGLVIAGKRQGLVASAADILRALRAAGLFLPPENTLSAELALLGETWP